MLTMAGIAISVNAESCYDIGYRYGECVTRIKFNLPCSEPEIVIPINCRGEKSTQQGIEDAVRIVYKLNSNINNKQYSNNDVNNVQVETDLDILNSSINKLKIKLSGKSMKEIQKMFGIPRRKDIMDSDLEMWTYGYTNTSADRSIMFQNKKVVGVNFW